MYKSILPNYSSKLMRPHCSVSRLNQHSRHLNVMPQTSNMEKSLKVLMLHGYTQNGTLFHAKTKALEKSLQKVFPGIQLHYPTGPVKLKPEDVPGFNPSQLQSGDDSEHYGWWRRSNTAEPVEYDRLEDGLEVIAHTLETEGPFDGVMGFSQGAAAAVIVASLLEGETRKKAFEIAQAKSTFGIPYPIQFERLDHPPLKFCVAYCGFPAPGPRYAGLYSEPHVQTPVCHVNGSLDSVVEENRTEGLINATGGREKSQVIIHPGGHFVPSGKQYLDAVAAFIKSTTTPKSENKQEVSAEDMDLPF